MKITPQLNLFIVICMQFAANVAHADLWSYSWDRNATGFNIANAPGGSDTGGVWQSANFSQDTVSNILSASVTLDVSANNTDALWMGITNGPTPSGLGGDWAGIYMANGQFFVAPDSNNPTSSHTIPAANVITTGTYNVSQSGSLKTFSFSLDTSIVNNWASAPGGWKGIGFPYDAQGNTAGDQWTPYRWGGWFRSFSDGAVNMTSGGGGYGWDVTWGQAADPKVGTWDLDGVVPSVTVVPEPGGAMLIGTAGILWMLRRRGRRN